MLFYFSKDTSSDKWTIIIFNLDLDILWGKKNKKKKNVQLQFMSKMRPKDATKTIALETQVFPTKCV